MHFAQVLALSLASTIFSVPCCKAHALGAQILSEDYSKAAFLCADRTVHLHARYGAHYATRIPRAGRDLAFAPEAADLLIVGSSPDIYRHDATWVGRQGPRTEWSSVAHARPQQGNLATAPMVKLSLIVSCSPDTSMHCCCGSSKQHNPIDTGLCMDQASIHCKC